jgi:hypothetical protein
MRQREDVRRALTRLFGKQPVADLDALRRALGTTSRTTVFRALSAVGYWTSYSHAGRYYTLADIPRFDAEGLWAHQDVLFSRDRTLRATITRMVGAAEAGLMHAELQERLRLRVHDTLHDLVEERAIGREELGGLYLYVSGEREKAASQVSARMRRESEVPAPRPPEPSVVIEVLLAVIEHPGETAGAIARRMAKHGRGIQRHEIDAVFEHYGLGEKKRRSHRSQG